MIETKIYVGLNDSETKKQLFETQKYKEILKRVCQIYHIPFSLSISEGGYFFENGEYTEELTLVLTLIDVPAETVKEVAKDLCVFFHQESVMVTNDSVDTLFISEHLDKKT